MQSINLLSSQSALSVYVYCVRWVCLQGREIPPWVHALCCQATTTASEDSLATQSLAAAPMAGKLVTALDILQHGSLMTAPAQLTYAEHLLPLVMTGACKHLYARALICPPLRAAVAQGILVFMAACCRNRCMCSWLCLLQCAVQLSSVLGTSQATSAAVPCDCLAYWSANTIICCDKPTMPGPGLP